MPRARRRRRRAAGPRSRKRVVSAKNQKQFLRCGVRPSGWDRARSGMTRRCWWTSQALARSVAGANGMPSPIPCGSIGAPHGSAAAFTVAETTRTGAGTLALRGPMVPAHAFPPGAERGREPHLSVDAAGFTDTGFRCRLDRDSNTLALTGPRPRPHHHHRRLPLPAKRGRLARGERRFGRHHRRPPRGPSQSAPGRQRAGPECDRYGIAGKRCQSADWPGRSARVSQQMPRNLLLSLTGR